MYSIFTTYNSFVVYFSISPLIEKFNISFLITEKK